MKPANGAAVLTFTLLMLVALALSAGRAASQQISASSNQRSAPAPRLARHAQAPDSRRYYGRPVLYAPAPRRPLPPFFVYGEQPW